MIYFLKTGFYYMSMSYVPLSGEKNNSIFFYFQIIEGKWRKMNISFVMIIEMGMTFKLTIAVFSLKINYSFYLYLFLVFTCHHLVPSQYCCVDTEKWGQFGEQNFDAQIKHYVYI